MAKVIKSKKGAVNFQGILDNKREIDDEKNVNQCDSKEGCALCWSMASVYSTLDIESPGHEQKKPIFTKVKSPA